MTDSGPPERDLFTLEQLLRRALVLSHGREAATTRDLFEASVGVTALVELLIAKGVIGLSEYDERRRRVADQISAQKAADYKGPILYPAEEEGGTPELVMDCERRHPQCRAACCRIYNVFLTAEEVRRGDLRWDLAEPYRLERHADGTCVYLDRESFRCTIWERRPHVCRRYSCATEGRIWASFDQMVITDELRAAHERAGA